MKNRVLKVASILMIIITVLLSSSIISIGGFTYNGVRYDSIESLAWLARNNNDLFREIPTDKILGSYFEFGYMDGRESNVVCIEHYNSSDSGTYGRVWRVIDINPDGPNTVRVNGSSKTGLSYNQKKYLNAVAEAASKCKGGEGFYGVTDTKAAYASLANSWVLNDIFKLNGDNTEEAYIYNSTVESYRSTYLEHGAAAASSTQTNVKIITGQDPDTTIVSDGAIIGPFKYKSEDGSSVSFNTIKITGTNDNNETVFETTINNPSAEVLFKDALGTKAVSNGSIASEQDFYIKTNKRVDGSAKVNVEINIKGPSYYQTRVLIFRQGDQQTFSAYSVGNGATNESPQKLEYEFELHRGNIEITKTGVKNGKDGNAAKYMGFKLYSITDKKKNTKQYYKFDVRDKKSNNAGDLDYNYVGPVNILKQETVSKQEDATIFYTNSKGVLAINGIDTRNQYYLEEVSDKSDYSTNILSAVQILDGKETNILKVTTDKNGNTIAEIGPITVHKRSQSAKTEIKLLDDIKRGILELEKIDADTGKPLSNVSFTIKTKTGNNWVVAELKNDGKYYLKQYEGQSSVKDYNNKIKYYSDNFTNDKSKATVFETNKDGKITIVGMEKGLYYIYEKQNKHFGYSTKGITEVTVDGVKIDSSKIHQSYFEVEVPGNDKGTAKVSVKANNVRNVSNLEIIKKDKDSGNNLADVSFKIQMLNTKTNQYQYIIVSKNDYVAGEEWIPDLEVVGEYEVGSVKYTNDASKATTFKTDDKGIVRIYGVLVGKYKVEEISVGKNYGYTEYDNRENIDPKHVEWVDPEEKTHLLNEDEIIITTVRNGSKKNKTTIVIKNKMKYMVVTGYVWEDIRGGKSNEYSYLDNDNVWNYQDLFAEGKDILVEGIKVRLKNKSGETLKETTTNSEGKYEFLDVLIEDLKDYYIEFEYNGLTYTSVTPLVGEDKAINSKAGEVVEQRKKLNSAFAEITNKDSINDRNHGYSRKTDGTVTGTLTYINDIENRISTFESSTYNNETYSELNVTANTNVAEFYLSKEFEDKQYIIREDGAYEIQNVNLGMRKRMQPQLSISSDVENVKVDVNQRTHIYNYNQKASMVEDMSAFNVGVKFQKGNSPEYRRAIYPSDIQFSQSQEDAKKLKVYITYSIKVANIGTDIQSAATEIVDYFDKDLSVVESYIVDPNNPDDNTNSVVWTETSKYGQSYNDGKYKGIYTTILADQKLKPSEMKTINIVFKVSDEAVLGLLNNTPTLNNVSEIYGYSTYYNNDSEGCKAGDIYAAIDEKSAPGNAKVELNSDNTLNKATFEQDTDNAPSLVLEAKGVRTIEGTVFEDKTDDNLLTAQERKGNGIYDEKENVAQGVKVDLIYTNGTISKIYPNITDENGNVIADINAPVIDATTTTNEKGYYIFRGIEPDTYILRYTYTNGEIKLFDITGKELDKEGTVQNYKSTILTSDSVIKAYEGVNIDAWYKETTPRYSKAKDNYTKRVGGDIIGENGEITHVTGIDEELKVNDSSTEATIKSLDANSPRLDLGVEYDTIYTASAGDYYEYKITNMDFGIVERPRQSAKLEKQISHIKVTFNNDQVIINGDPRKDKMNYVTVTDTGIYITIDSEIMIGAHVEIDYELILTNTSEIDYISENYYYYGIKDGEPVKLTKAAIVDYVDKELVLKDNQDQWKVLDLANNGYNWNLSQAQKDALLQNYSTIVEVEPLDGNKELEPGESSITAVLVEKLISSSKDELEFNNNGEVVTITKNGGSKLIPTVGKYIYRLAENPEAAPESGLETESIPAVLIPPTGLTNNTIIYAIIGIISLVGIGAGVFGIKKFLKK